MEREDKQSDPSARKNGSQEMVKGTKLVRSSTTDLFELIRSEFGLENLPGDILDIKQPDEKLV